MLMSPRQRVFPALVRRRFRLLGFRRGSPVWAAAHLAARVVVSGFLRLRGAAKAVELALLMQHTHVLGDRVEGMMQRQQLTELQMSWLVERIASIAEAPPPVFSRTSAVTG
mmetsp:Transcript_23402/g.79267  ORF Transcript_23402/g.79267 Transcript_23402/m.79267 type:complete len:111 (-) Transcript_23402:71-403(-)